MYYQLYLYNWYQLNKELAVLVLQTNGWNDRQYVWLGWYNIHNYGII